MHRTLTRSLAVASLAGLAAGAIIATAPPLNAATPQRTTHSADQARTPAPVINEVETNGDDVDWVELANPSSEALDLSGYILTDSEPESHAYTLPDDTVIPAGGFFTITQQEKAAPGFDFGLGAEDAVQIFVPGADVSGDPLVQHSWTTHATVTWGRCPDVTGDFVDTFASSRDAANVCEDPGTSAPSGAPWPGGQDVTVLDDADEDRGDWSGIDVEPLGSGADAPDGGNQSQAGRLWVVQNGDGELYRLNTVDAGKSWSKDSTWTLHYPDGTGTVDAEGVTVTTSAATGVYVSSERDNDKEDVSRPAVLRYSVPEAAAAGDELSATQEWNLASDFPGLGANSGLEGITWIPDNWLTRHEFVDEAKKGPYDPASYPGHGDGLFAVAVEGTGDVYLYALQSNGAFHRVATLDPGFDSIADVQFDADRNRLWAVCDDACDGQIATFSLKDGAFSKTAVYDRPADTDNYGNEGFAIAPVASCRNGVVNTYYVDDNNTDGHSLRQGTLSTQCPAGTPSSPASTRPTAPTPSGTGTTPAAAAPTTSHTAAPTAPSSASDSATTKPAVIAADETTPSGTTRAEAMASTGLPASTWLIVAGAALLLVAGFVLYRTSRQH